MAQRAPAPNPAPGRGARAEAPAVTTAATPCPHAGTRSRSGRFPFLGPLPASGVRAWPETGRRGLGSRAPSDPGSEMRFPAHSHAGAHFPCRRALPSFGTRAAGGTPQFRKWGMAWAPRVPGLRLPTWLRGVHGQARGSLGGGDPHGTARGARGPPRLPAAAAAPPRRPRLAGPAPPTPPRSPEARSPVTRLHP